MLKLQRNLKIVIVESPYDCWPQKGVPELFNKMVKLKLEGYRAEYNYGVLPLDTTDFIATHMLVCQETENGLTPLTGFKAVSLERCDIHHIPFPALTLAKQGGDERHVLAVEKIIERCRQRAVALSYAGSWTIDPRIHLKDRELSKLLRQIFSAMYVYHHLGWGEVIAGGTHRFKTEKMLKDWGHEPLSLEGEILPPIHVAPLLGEIVTIMHCQKFSESIRFAVNPFQAMWDDRLKIRPQAPFKSLKVA